MIHQRDAFVVQGIVLGGGNQSRWQAAQIRVQRAMSRQRIRAQVRSNCCTNQPNACASRPQPLALELTLGWDKVRSVLGQMSSTALDDIDALAKRAAASTAIAPPALSPASAGFGMTGPTWSGSLADQRATLNRSSTAAGAGCSGASR